MILPDIFDTIIVVSRELGRVVEGAPVGIGRITVEVSYE